MKSLTPEQIDLLKTTQAHISALRQANSPRTDEHILRVASTSLRFLIVEGYLIQAWKASAIGGPIEVEAYCFAAPPGSSAIAFCGGADILPGIPLSLGWYPQPERPVELALKKLNLSAFLQHPCAYLRGTRISRHDLIKYIANTKGGTHYDPLGKSPRSRAAKFALLRDVERGGLDGLGIAFNERNLIHHELASTIKSILGSSQIERLRTQPFGSV